MKLLYVANTRFPSERAHATQIAHMCQAFSQLGNEVTLVTNDRTKATLRDIERWIGFVPNFSFIQIRFGIVFAPTIILTFLLNHLVFTFLLTRQLKLSEADVIYTRDEWLCYFLSFVVPKHKLVFESHEAKYNFALRKLVEMKIKIICISQGVLNEYLHRNIPSAQMTVAYDGIDDGFFTSVEDRTATRERLGLPQNARVVMYIGGFDKWKGVECFFKASEYVSQVMFSVIGGKPDEISLYKMKYPKVIFLGSHPYRNLKNNQQAADILVIPNSNETDLGARYASPLKLFAHMASNVPILVSNVPSVSTVLSDKEATFFQPDNAHAMAATIEHMFGDYAVAQTKAKRAYQKSQHYSWKNRAKKIIDFLTKGNTFSRFS
ncbi:MAG: glycosyltransferase family 4 protein [Patescibacteria group bacterium]